VCVYGLLMSVLWMFLCMAWYMFEGFLRIFVYEDVGGMVCGLREVVWCCACVVVCRWMSVWFWMLVRVVCGRVSLYVILLVCVSDDSCSCAYRCVCVCT